MNIKTTKGRKTMNSIQTMKEYIKTFSDEQLMNEFDLYRNLNHKGIKEIIYQQVIEYELYTRKLLAFKIAEDNYEYEYAQ
jgi:hypothetical protein